MKVKKVFANLFLVFTLVFSLLTPNSVSASGINLSINGKSKALSSDIVNKSGLTYAPFREIFEALGAYVYWDATNQQAVAKTNGRTVKVRASDSYAEVTIGKTTSNIKISPPFIQNGQTYVPIRDAAEALGFEVDWISSTQTIDINVVPTVFVHGFSGNENTFKESINILSNEFSQLTHKVIVKSNGDVSLNKIVSENIKVASPLVSVVFESNNASLDEQGAWINDAAAEISKEFNTTNMNFVTHSMGGLALTRHIVDTNGKYVKKLVTLGSPIDGAGGANFLSFIREQLNISVNQVVTNDALDDLARGSSAIKYNHDRKGSFPKNIGVLSYAGRTAINTVDYNDHDGYVSVQSAFYLSNYTDNINCVRAWGADHSYLHDSPYVLDTVKKFLIGADIWVTQPNVNSCDLMFDED
ncbi:alpha/beta hydrolase [Hazenella sp. IB182357]|uniref:Alpha/beta hydrolase n=1 Tax=Polycladospora coralii TaxID=2771432 RepID=A0A926NDS1_9BACL|nr:alpha/beta hydrolase [Polycladospora coralii]MBD1373975.1 alpha/beta hydrolase [Polycladospora coralii]